MALADIVFFIKTKYNMAKKTIKLYSGHYAQFADRTACVMHMVQELLIDNPVADKLENFKPTLIKIKEHLDDLYKESQSHKADGNNFEIGDRAYCFFSTIEELFVRDSELSKDKKAHAFARSAANKFWHLYQHLGKKLVDEEFKDLETIVAPRTKGKKR